MDVFKQFSTSYKAENDGVWSDLGDNSKILVARSGNRKYARLLTALVEKHQRVLDLKTEVATALSDEIMISVTAESVLLGWENIQFKGADLPYSVENAKLLLSVKDFRRLVGKLSDDVELYRGADEETVAKN